MKKCLAKMKVAVMLAIEGSHQRGMRVARLHGNKKMSDAPLSCLTLGRAFVGGGALRGACACALCATDRWAKGRGRCLARGESGAWRDWVCAGESQAKRIGGEGRYWRSGT